MTVWQLQLLGDFRDLEFLVNALSTGPRRVLRDELQQGYIYESDSFHDCSTFEEVNLLAGGEVAILSGILKLELDARDNLDYGAIYRPNPSGGRDIFLRAHEHINMRVDINAATFEIADGLGHVIKTPAPLPRSVLLLQLASRDKAVAKVLRLLGTADAKDWGGLHRIQEVIDGDIGGQHKLQKQDWISAEELRLFKQTANSVQASGDKSRHGKELSDPPEHPMKLEVAEALVNYLIQAWLVYKGL